ncbi:hypothetical protein IP90_02155 [Luteimonas cucumeris]|uniref:Secreted protein n=2 Tax=Luteimonas cucumeris TaxID=985012 RepID=A0A562L5Z8_9GAMM|nr:hypothetical protein IP90_02155 [Luteimonas cucumeris]
MVRLCLALLLVCACAGASARDMSMLSPNGETGTCPEVEETTAPKATATTAPAPTPVRKPVKPSAATQGGGGEASVRTQGPRWHSFLPGMFR